MGCCSGRQAIGDLESGPVFASLNYRRVEEGKVCGRYAGQEDKGDMTDVDDPVNVWIHDARSMKSAATLENIGFELRKYPSKCLNLEDDDEIKKVYYPEVEKLVMTTSGASRVMVFDHKVRHSELIGGSMHNIGAKNTAVAPGLLVHTDYTDESAPNRLRQLANNESYTGFKLTPQDAEQIIQKRYVFINVWRNIRNEPVQRNPLALCDPQTVENESIQTYELRYPDRTGGNYVLTRGKQSEHKWYYFPLMTREEALVFKVFESKKDAKVRNVFHSAFAHPNTTLECPPRHSIEIRTIAVFDD